MLFIIILIAAMLFAVLSTPLINEDEQELLDSVLPEIKSQHREDYLDLALDDEAQYLVEYKLRLPT